MAKDKATFGVNFNEVQSQRGGELPPGHYTFEITDVRFPQTDDAGNKYANIGCTVIRPKDKKNRMKWQYCSMAPSRIGWTKAFFEDIGRADLLKKNGEPKSAEGTIFEADIQKRGEYYDLVNIKPVDEEEPDPDEEPENDDSDEDEEEPEDDEDEDSDDEEPEDDDDEEPEDDEDEEEDEPPPPPRRKVKKGVKKEVMKKKKTAPRKSKSARRR